MPYIKPHRRTPLKPRSDMTAVSPGDLNFQITCLLKEYIQHCSLSYLTISDVIGALEGAKLEFYRRVALPYENAKIVENGDVYES